MISRIRAEHVAIALGVPLLFPLLGRLDAHTGEPATVMVTLPPEQILPVLVCGHGGLAADLLEVQTVNYVFENLHPGRLLDHAVVERLYGGVTALDPYDPTAVRRGAIMLGALSDSPREALALLDRGLARVPPEHTQRWALYWEQAAIYLTSLPLANPEAREEYIHRAGQLLLEAARQPGTPNAPLLESWGLRLSTRGLSPLQALEQEAILWEERVGQGEGAVREQAAQRLAETRSRIGRERLQARLERFRRQVGRDPERLEQLAALPPAEPLPEDPLGAGYFLQAGQVLAPAADARSLQRRLEHALDDWRAGGGRGTPTLQELGVVPAEVPGWLRVSLAPDAARVDLDLGLLRR